MNAEGKAISGGINLSNNAVQIFRRVANDMKYWPKDFIFKLVYGVEFKDMGRNKAALLTTLVKFNLGDKRRFTMHTLDMGIQFSLCSSVYDRPQITA